MPQLSDKLITGDGRTISIGNVVDLYRKTVNLSIPIAGQIKSHGKDTLSLIVKSCAVNYEADEKVMTFKNYHLAMKKMTDGSQCIDMVRPSSDIQEFTELASASSINGHFLARLMSKSNDKQILQIWECNRLIRTLVISEIHGSIVTHPTFSSFTWSPFGNQDKLLYVCVPKKIKQVSFFEDSNNDSDPSTRELGEEFIKKEDWGESLDGIGHTIVGIIDVADNFKVTVIDQDDCSLSFPQWLDNGNKIVSTAYEEKPRRLGIVYCNNRPSSIMVHDWRPVVSLAYHISSSSGDCYHSHRVNNLGEKFLYLSNPTLGAHEHAVKMNLFNIRDQTSKSFKDELFIEDLPTSCFTRNDEHIVLKTHDHLYQHLYLYNLANSKLVEIKFPTTGISILDFKYDIILASGSEVNSTPAVFVASLNSSDINDVVAWHQIEDSIHLDEIEYESHKIEISDQSSFVSALLVRPNLRALQFKQDSVVSDYEIPTVVVVHGGPHGAFLLGYLPLHVLFANLGLKTLFINYRGSTGVNEAYVQSLPGKVGAMDVDDCLHVIRHFVHSSSINPSKLIIYGGSHGGFLASHLSCQDEFQFTSAIIKNPVIDISTLYSTSDIPDWSWTEALSPEEYRFDLLPDKVNLTKMFECSPICKYQRANVPTLMLLGNKDRRVNMYQGERWVDILRARGIETLCKIYPDKHDLSEVKVAADAIVTIAIWILNHLPK